MRRLTAGPLAALLAWVLAATPGTVSAAPDAVAMSARSGLDLATAAARSWADDATLVYIENDEAVDGGGTATRWGYLFHSESAKRSRAYSVGDGKIQVAEDLAMQLEAPPLATEWIDSGEACAIAARAAARVLDRSGGGRLRSMLLLRGAFHDGDPDATTWTFVYEADGQPGLFIVVDARDGSVRRTWRG